MILPLLLALQAPAPLAARADSIRPLHDALDYDITIIVGDTGSHIVGQVQTRWRLESDLPVRIDLDSTMRVVRVLMDGKENTRLFRTIWAREPNRIIVPHEKHQGDTLVTMVRYHGTPKDGLIIGNNAYGARTAFADNWPDRAHHWLASQDQPDDKATARFHVEVPAGMEGIANGTLEKVDTLPRGRTVWHYRIREPVPVYTMVVAAARFATTRLPDAACALKCVPISIKTYPEDSAFAVQGPFRRAGEIVDFFSHLIGAFPFERLSQVESATIYGGMENATAIFYDQKAYGKKSLSEETVAHETAHQWFGDAVTEDDWHHLWLSEGFATYFAGLWEEHVGGRQALDSVMGQAAERVFESTATERPILDLQATDLMGLLNSNNYPKGAWVLHSLRGLMGDSAFFGGIREYYRRYRDSTVLSADFAAVMSAAAGQDLTWYFTQALTQPGYPVLEVTWSYAKKRLTLAFTQTQNPAWGEYRLPGITVLVDGKPVRVNIEGRNSQAVIENVVAAPKSVVVDPERWWLLKWTTGERGTGNGER